MSRIVIEHAVKKYGDNVVIFDLNLNIRMESFSRCWGLLVVERLLS